MINRLNDIKSNVGTSIAINSHNKNIKTNNERGNLQIPMQSYFVTHASSASDLPSIHPSQAMQKNHSFGMVSHHSSESDSIVSIGGTTSIFKPIEMSLRQIDMSSKRIDVLYGIKRTGIPSEQRRAMNEVDNIVLEITPQIRNAKNLLERAKEQITINQKQNSEMKTIQKQWFSNMFNSLTKRFQSSVMRFQESTQHFKNAVCEDFTRQARIVDPEISDQQIQAMLQAHDPSQYLQNNIMAISPELLDEVHELEEEHERLKKLEQTIEEVQELFNACAVLVAQTQEHLDVIVTNVENTKVEVERGKKHLKKTETYVRQTRKTKIKTTILAIICLLIIAVIILGPVLQVFPWLNPVNWFKSDNNQGSNNNTS